jgi:hypothetical protein
MLALTQLNFLPNQITLKKRKKRKRPSSIYRFAINIKCRRQAIF